MRVRTLLIASALGVGVAWLALNAFGLWVAFHPFGRDAERTAWLVPLLQVLSWLPFVALGTILTSWLLRELSVVGGFAAGLAASAAVLGASFYYAPGENLVDVASLLWLDLLCPVALFPAFVGLVANRSFKQTPHSGAA